MQTLPSLDYDALRKEGIEHIQKLAGKLWTNHNPSDPGITILEQLCYAITDLDYRIDHPMEDLLATTDGSDPYKSLYSPAQILTTQPVTLNDWRRLLIDIDGVKNAWIELVNDPQPSIYYDTQGRTLTLAQKAQEEKLALKGVYNVYLEQDELSAQSGADIFNNSLAKLHQCRNANEDFNEIQLLNNQEIYLDLTLDIEKVDDANLLMGEVYYKVARAISPRIEFYNLEQLLAKGHTIDNIFEGPALQHGFIDDKELDAAKRPTQIRASDLIQVIMDVPGVLNVRKIVLCTGSSTREDWVLKLDSSKAPKFAIEQTKTTLNQGDLSVPTNPSLIEQHYHQLRDTALPKTLEEKYRNVVLNKGTNRELKTYYSVQNTFPQTYGITEYGLPDSATTQRKGQAKQLKAYLLFFEQILANYLAQIAHCKDLFSFDYAENRTYFYQQLSDRIPDSASIFAADYSTQLPQLTESDNTALERKNRLLNHLMARFAEQLTDYSLMIYGLYKDNEWNQATTKLVQDKKAFLRDYPTLSAGRGQAFDYTQSAWSTSNITVLEKRVRRMLGIAELKRSSFTSSSQEGFHVVEHLLLRPRYLPADANSGSFITFGRSISDFSQSTNISSQVTCTSTAHGLKNGDFIEIYGSTHYSGVYPVSYATTNTFDIVHANKGKDAGSWTYYNQHKDIFSFQVSFVFPDYIGRFKDASFRTLVAQTIRSATPAHLHVYLHWFSSAQMLKFEQSYEPLLNALKDNKNNVHFENAGALISLLNLGEIGIPYSLSLNALSFDGLDNYVKVASYTELANLMGANTSFTFSLWFKTHKSTPNTNEPRLIAKRYADDVKEAKGFELYLDNSGKPCFAWDNGATTALCTGTKNAADGLWHHLAIVKSNNKVTFYLDEQASGESTNTNFTKTCLNDRPLYIGSNGHIGRNFEGKIAEVRIWKQALRLEEIQQHKNRPLLGTEGNLIGYWKLDEAANATQAKDTSTQAKHGSIELFGNKVLPYTFTANNPLPLDGIDDHVEIAPSASTPLSTAIGANKAFTLSLWFKTKVRTHAPRLISKRQLGSPRKGVELYIDHTTGKVYADLDTGATQHTLKGSTAVDDNQWHHIALVITGSRARLYLNGQLDKSNAFDSSSSGFDSTSKWCIGGAEFPGAPFKGQIADVRIWKQERTQAAIDADRQKRLQGNESNLIGYWKMDETTGTTVNDSSSSSLDGVRILSIPQRGIGTAKIGSSNYVA